MNWKPAVLRRRPRLRCACAFVAMLALLSALLELSSFLGEGRAPLPRFPDVVPFSGVAVTEADNKWNINSTLMFGHGHGHIVGKLRKNESLGMELALNESNREGYERERAREIFAEQRRSREERERKEQLYRLKNSLRGQTLTLQPSLGSSDSLPVLGSVLLPEHLHVTGNQLPTKSYLTVGIPSVSRPAVGMRYLVATLRSLTDQSNGEQRHHFRIVVFVAERNATVADRMTAELRQGFRSQLSGGSLLIMRVDDRAYPPLRNLKQNFNDSVERVLWRSKQNCDYAFMAEYARGLSEFYLQLEDDVLSAANWFRDVRNFVQQSLLRKKVVLRFSSLGFIGVLMPDKLLPIWSRFLMLFYQEQPVDWLVSHFLKLMVLPQAPICKPTLFQHIGHYSSLKGKLMDKFVDKFFKATSFPVHKTSLNGTNPPALLFTDMEIYWPYVPQNAYAGSQSFFWAKTPPVGSFLLVLLDAPKLVRRVVVDTGNPSEMKDYLRAGVLEFSSRVLNSTNSTGEYPRCAEWASIASFGEYHFDHQVVPPRSVRCIRIRVTRDNVEWLIIRNIHVSYE